MSHAVVLVAIDSGDIEKLVEEQMRPFDENGECFADGSRWDWWVIGGRWNNYVFPNTNVIKRKDLSIPMLLQYKRELLIAGGYVYNPELTLDEYVNTHLTPLTASAFLKNKTWTENGRMGWFGMSTVTECEVRGEEPNICKYVHEGNEAQTITYNISQEDWQRGFWDRFIEKLDPETRLVVVDYHV